MRKKNAIAPDLRPPPCALDALQIRAFVAASRLHKIAAATKTAERAVLREEAALSQKKHTAKDLSKMVKALDSFMASVQQIVNDKHISGDSYVYFKKGKLHTEGWFRHAFTFSSTKARTAQYLAKAFARSYEGQDALSARSHLNRGLSGLHQVKVSELRNAFHAAEDNRLKALAAELQRCYGERMGSALAPLVEQSGPDKPAMSVTQQMIGEVMDKAFGKGLSNVVLAGTSGAYLESMPELMSAAKAQADAIGREPERVKNAVFDVCRKGPLTKAAVVETVKQFFASSRLKKLAAEVRQLPEKPSLDAVMTLFQHADRLYRQAQFDDFEETVLKNDRSLCHYFELPEMAQRGDELTDAVREDIQSRLPEAREGAARVRSAAERFLTAHAGASKDCQTFVKNLAEALVTEGGFTDEAIEGMLAKADDRYLRETDFDYGLRQELQRHEGWSEDEQNFFSDVMKRLHAVLPQANLFTEGSQSFAELAAKVMERESGPRARDVAACGREGEILYVALLAVLRDNMAPVLCEKLPQIFAAKNPADVTINDVAEACWGQAIPLEAMTSFTPVAKWFDARQGDFIDERLKTPERRAACLREARRQMPRGKTADVELQAEALLLQKVQSVRPYVQSALQAGLSLEAAIAHANNRRLPLALADFVIKPSAHSQAIPPREEAMAAFVSDFQRQGEHESNRSAAGATSITVTNPKGGVTTVRNGSDGFTEEELADFNRSRETARHRTVASALEALCGENARQCDAAIAMLGQGGPVSFLRLFAKLVEGAGGMEHSAATYQFKKSENGDVVLVMATAADDNAARLDVTVIIHPDGTHELENFSLEAPKAPAGGN